MVKRNKVMSALGQKAKSGTHVVWLDQVLPMYRKSEWSIHAVIGMVKSTNHRFRVVTIYRRLDTEIYDDALMGDQSVERIASTVDLL